MVVVPYLSDDHSVEGYCIVNSEDAEIISSSRLQSYACTRTLEKSSHVATEGFSKAAFAVSPDDSDEGVSVTGIAGGFLGLPH